MKRSGGGLRARGAAARARLRTRLRAVGERYRSRRVLTPLVGALFLVLVLMTFGHERRVADATRSAALGQPDACAFAVERCERYLSRVGLPLRLLGRDCAVDCGEEAPGERPASP